MEPRLIDVIKALIRRGQPDDLKEANYCLTVIPVELFFKHGLDERSVMNMTMDEIEGWYQKPPKPAKYDGWNFWWGAAVDADYRERNI